MNKLFLVSILSLVSVSAVFAETWMDEDGNTWSFSITDKNNKYVKLTGLSSRGNATVPGSVFVNDEEYAVQSIGGFTNNQSIIAVGDLPYCTSIGFDAFRACRSLEKVGNLPSCEKIDAYAFEDCASLTSIGQLPACTEIRGSAFNRCSLLECIDIPNCTRIDKGAFNGCRALRSVGDLSACSFIGDAAFNGCYSLSTITLGATPPIVDGTGLALQCFATFLVPADAIDDYAAAEFWRDYPLRIVSNDSKVDWVVEVSLEENNSGLQTAIREENLNSVLSLKVTGDINSYDIFVMRNKMPNLHFLDLSDANIKSSDYTYYQSYHSEENVFPAYGFYDLPKLNSIKLPKSIIKIDKAACYECLGLNELTMYEGVQEIKDDAFRDTYLKELIVPEGVTEIGNTAFGYIGNLFAIALPSTVRSLGNNTFRANRARVINVPSAVTTIGEGCFYGCSKLESIQLPANLEKINKSTFYNCSSLAEIALPAKIVSIESSAFQGCANLRTVYASALDPATVSMQDNSFSDYTNKTLYVPYDEETEWDATYYAYYWNTQWGQFAQMQKWKPDYSEILIENDYNQDKGTIPSTGSINGTIGKEGGYIVGSGASQNLGQLAIEFEEKKGGSVVADGELAIDRMSCNIKISPNKWYFFCFPYDVDWTQIEYVGNYIWHEYDGSERAQGNKGWKKLQGNVNDKILKAGKGYIFQTNQPCTLNINFIQPDLSAVDKVTSLESHSAANTQDASWNFVGNPYFCYFNMNDLKKSSMDGIYTAPITVWTGNGYEALRPGDDDYQFTPYQAFFIQKPTGETSITFSKEGRETYTQSITAAALAAQRRAMVPINPKRQLVNLTVSNGESIDKTRVVFNDAASMDYELECDASKFFSTENAPQLYSVHNGVNYAINERPNADGKVALGIKIFEAGTFSIRAARMDTPVLLIDNESGVITDLNKGEYGFTSEAGTFDNRFILIKAEEAAALNEIKADANEHTLDTYDLNGRKAANNQHGVMIKDRKKVVLM